MSLVNNLCAIASLSEVAALIHRREVSPGEVLTDALDRIARHDPVIRAFISVTEPLARQAAQKLDAEWMRGELRGPLHGIPLAYKDNIAVAGAPCTANSRSRANWVPASDAHVVGLLRQAGGVTVGKTALWELAGAPPTEGSLFPSPRNPWNLDHTAGGSSSGSGAAVAAGFCLGAIGTDTGGSVRNPAASCGLVGCKPTFDLVSTAGVIPLSPTLDHVGPITRTVADNLLLLNGMLVSDPRSVNAWPEILYDSKQLLALGVRHLRCGVPRHTLTRFAYSESCLAAFEQALAVLTDLGAEVIDIDLRAFDDAAVLGGDITAVEALEIHGDDMAKHPGNYESSFHERLDRARTLTAPRRAELELARARCRQALASLTWPIDVIVTPGAGDTADSFATLQTPGYGPKADYTRMYNVAGMPALVMPMGLAPDGLPLSVQFAAHPFREDLLYRAALAYEATTGHTQARPGFCLS